jgi:hypothetical protein
MDGVLQALEQAKGTKTFKINLDYILLHSPLSQTAWRLLVFRFVPDVQNGDPFANQGGPNINYIDQLSRKHRTSRSIPRAQPIAAEIADLQSKSNAHLHSAPGGYFVLAEVAYMLLPIRHLIISTSLKENDLHKSTQRDPCTSGFFSDHYPQ